MHPSVIADALPPSLAGKALRTAAPLESLPLQGRWMRRKAQTEGYGAFLGLYPRGLAGACRRVALPHCLLACCLPQSQAPLCRERCLHRPATPAAAPMLPGGRNRPPYRPGQTAGGTGNVVPTTSIYLSCRPFAADRRAGVHARRLGPCRIARWRVVCPQSQVPPVPGAMPALPRNPCIAPNAARRAKSPALQIRANGRRNRERRPYDQHLFILSPVRGRS